ncbi:amidohydrolase family protein [Natronobacterium gregoryi]|uniref:Amidohydrolase n=2 Tax=Natronobacterium gregoryi TaxID=44930 RepID=L0ANB8_NATGS|nr:amidohydrolase family protein [Natronobacterium gregoryi]AFZ74682.1 cytosine deaminase-like metal-dependent hydrolase [Natronobacterium gregoryi SP2]ELY73413.1 amidohydrolase [Natronobacterium gregoryi SP2]PLK20927.1 nucleoside deaminase [Natronobacterium gregoryi SP2]SFJ04937.1 Cytosine/adenosine deaminase [Natronobacterium gregoryi]
MELTGTILRGREFEPIEGRVVIDDEGRIAAIEEAAVGRSAIVLPAFVNAHTHVGDSIAKEAGRGLSLEELVAPPDGLKHRLLREASREEKVAAMVRSLQFMHRSGTAACLDFREGGVEGVRALEAAAADVEVDAIAFGRESIDAIEAGDGFGASGANDADFERERTATREAGKPFGIHAGEVDETDIDPAMDLDPDFLVHMVHPEPVHLDRVADCDVPTVVCPRSNLVTGVGLPPVEKLHERTTLALGTDNVMLNSPSMFREMEFLAKFSDLPADDILRMATVNGAELAGLEYGVVEPGRKARLLVLDGETDNLVDARDPVRAVVRRAGVDDVCDVIVEG